jgi:hypothetical protein
MNCFKTVAGSGLAMVLMLSAPIAWSQSESNGLNAGSEGAYHTDWSPHENVSLMDQNLSREIRQAWFEGENATAAMAFQENGEIAMGEGKEKEAKQYFQSAEQELESLTPDHSSD